SSWNSWPQMRGSRCESDPSESPTSVRRPVPSSRAPAGSDSYRRSMASTSTRHERASTSSLRSTPRSPGTRSSERPQPVPYRLLVIGELDHVLPEHETIRLFHLAARPAQGAVGVPL